MKSAELRDATDARVKEAFAKWRTFADMPQAGKKTVFDIRVGFKADLSTPVNYIEALYSMCAVSTPVARLGNDMVGLTDEAAAHVGQGVDDKGVRLEL
jgi:hypothetical protein